MSSFGGNIYTLSLCPAIDTTLYLEEIGLDRELPVVQKDLESGAIRWIWRSTAAITLTSIFSSKVSGSGACMGWERSMCASSCGPFWLCMDTAGVPVC